MATAYLEHTLSAADTNGNKKATFSAWMKRATTGAEHVFYTVRQSGTNFFRFRFDSDKINVTSNTSGTNYYATTDAVFKDPSAFYHVVVAYDTTQATEANRIRIYVNGVEQSKSASNYPSQDATLFMIASGQPQRVGQESGGGYFDGIMAHVHYTEGYAYAATDFGQTDSTSGIWKPKTAPSVTYGTNGFFLKFENSGAMGTDSSGNSNTFTVNNSITQNVDTPSNNFATLNPLDNPYPGQKATFSNANLTGAGTEGGFLAGASSFGLSSGKWYAEFKLTAGTSSYQVMGAAISPVGDMGTQAPHDNTNFYGVRGNGTKYQPGGTGTNSWTSTWTTNDIISLALDCDNNRLYIAKNGQYADGSGNYDEAFTGSPAYITLASDKTYHLMGASITTGSGNSLTMQSNFGSGFFGTTAVASANADANGYGAFEYAVPSGYYAICTKNIKEFG